MKQRATVVSTEGKYCDVKVDRASMCSGCHKGECGDACALYKIFGAKTEFTATAENRAGASVGDTVTVEAPDSFVNLSAFFVFLLPVIVAAATYLLTFFIEGEQYRILAALASFALYFVILSAVERRRKNRSVKLVVSEIVSGNN